jgi:hypothetical protein
MLKHSKAKPFENWFDLGCGEPRVALRISAYLQCQVVASECSDEILSGIETCLRNAEKGEGTINAELDSLSKPMTLEDQLESGVHLAKGEGEDYFKDDGGGEELLLGDVEEDDEDEDKDDDDDDDDEDDEDDESCPVLYDTSPETMKRNAVSL